MTKQPNIAKAITSEEIVTIMQEEEHTNGKFELKLHSACMYNKGSVNRSNATINPYVQCK